MLIILLILAMFCISIFTDKRIKILINRINKHYQKIFRDRCLLIKIFQASFIVIDEALTILIIYRLAEKLIIDYNIELWGKIILFCFGFIMVHYTIGMVLLYYNEHNYIKREEDSLTGDFLLSYFLIVASIFSILTFKNCIKLFTLSFIAADLISYLINVKLIILYMIIGKRRYKKEGRINSFFIIFISAVIVVIMLILNLYIGVVIVNSTYTQSFTNSPGYFDLFYYTVVTFTTIGFGDIVPLNTAAKAMAVCISCTSILCITIFLSSLYSFREKR